jgi:hypothetical protein
MRILETLATPTFWLFPGYISAFLDHNLEIRIGSKGLIGQAQGMRWSWEWGLCKVLPTSPLLGTSSPVCPGPYLQPFTPPHHVCVPAHVYFFSHPFFRGESGGGSQWLPCMAGSFGYTLCPFYGLS